MASQIEKPLDVSSAHRICKMFGEHDCSVLYAAPHWEGANVKVVIGWETGRAEFFSVQEVLEYILTHYR